MRVLVLLLVLFSGCSPKFEGTSVTPRDVVQAINEDRKSITLLTNSLIEVIKKFNEFAPPDKKIKEFKTDK